MLFYMITKNFQLIVKSSLAEELFASALMLYQPIHECFFM